MSIFSCCFAKKKEIDNHVSMNNQMFPCKHIDFIIYNFAINHLGENKILPADIENEIKRFIKDTSFCISYIHFNFYKKFKESPENTQTLSLESFIKKINKISNPNQYNFKCNSETCKKQYRTFFESFRANESKKDMELEKVKEKLRTWMDKEHLEGFQYTQIEEKILNIQTLYVEIMTHSTLISINNMNRIHRVFGR